MVYYGDDIAELREVNEKIEEMVMVAGDRKKEGMRRKEKQKGEGDGFESVISLITRAKVMPCLESFK